MNFLRLTVFSLLITALAACGDDDTMISCTQADWVGTYEGTITCDGTTEDVTVTITASGTEDIIIIHETTTVMTEYDPLTPNSCDLDVSLSSGGVSAAVSATLDGDNLTLSESLSGGGITSSCNLSATRK